jgi:hypothetical protein
MMWLNQRKLGLIVLFLISTTAVLICGGPAQAGQKEAYQYHFCATAVFNPQR